MEFLPAAFNLTSYYTTLDMIVDQRHGLHEGVDGGRADEFPPLLFQCLRERDGLNRCGCTLRYSEMPPPVLELPDVGRKDPSFLTSATARCALLGGEVD